jgi:hypothetical protein
MWSFIDAILRPLGLLALAIAFVISGYAVDAFRQFAGINQHALPGQLILATLLFIGTVLIGGGVATVLDRRFPAKSTKSA